MKVVLGKEDVWDGWIDDCWFIGILRFMRLYEIVEIKKHIKAHTYLL